MPPVSKVELYATIRRDAGRVCQAADDPALETLDNLAGGHGAGWGAGLRPCHSPGQPPDQIADYECLLIS